MLQKLCLTLCCAVALSSCGGGSGHSADAAKTAGADVAPKLLIADDGKTILLYSYDEQEQSDVESERYTIYNLVGDRTGSGLVNTASYVRVVEQPVDLGVTGSENYISVPDNVHITNLIIDGDYNIVEFADNVSVEKVTVRGDENYLSIPESIQLEYIDQGYGNQITSQEIYAFQAVPCKDVWVSSSVVTSVNGTGSVLGEEDDVWDLGIFLCVLPY